MTSVGTQLRQDTRDRVARLSAAERIELALSLGRDDLLLYMRVTGQARDAALRALRAQRTHGRAPSCAARPRP